MTTLPSGWVAVTLGDLVRAEYGQGLRAQDRHEDGAVPVFGSAGVVGHHDQALVDETVVVVGRKGNAGACYVAEGSSWPIDTTYFLRVPHCIDPQFLSLQLSFAGLRALDSSTAVPSLRRPALQAVTLLLAPPAEQRRVVAAIEEQFSRIDAAAESLGAAERRVALMRSAVNAAATGGDLPEVPLGDLADSMRYGTSVKCRVDADGPPVLRIPNIRSGRIDATDLKCATVERSTLGDCFVERGDLLFVRTNGSKDLIGRVAAVTDETGPAFASYLIRARPNRALVDPEWLVLALSTPATRALIESRAATTAGQYNLNLQSLRSIPVPLPALDEQRRRIAVAAGQQSRLEAMGASIATARRRAVGLRRSVLERAFRGELVPQDPSDEPASVLLERIRAERAAAGPQRRRLSRRTARSGRTSGTSGR